MPDWCDNNLKVTGPSADLDRFVAGGVDFNTAVPYPEPFKSMDEAAEAWDAAHPYGSRTYKKHFAERPDDGFNQGGYEWCVDHWGTKWNARSQGAIERRRTPEEATVLFMTAETPPVPVVKAWSAKYPTLTFSLRFEDAAGRPGQFTARNGRKLMAPKRPSRGRRGRRAASRNGTRQ